MVVPRTHNSYSLGSTPGAGTKVVYMLKTNPFPEILELIPETDTVVSLLLSDKIRIVVEKSTNKHINNAFVLMLLVELAKAGYVELKEFGWHDSNETIFIIKKVINGNQNK